MEVYRNLSEVPDRFRGGAVVLGNFDGVHRGHQAVIGKAATAAKTEGQPLGVVTFDPHPRAFFRPHDAPFYLTSIEEKARLMEALGVDFLLVLPFDKTLSNQAPEEFVKQVIVDGVRAKSVAVGFNFRFGHRRSGDGALLTDLGVELGFEVSLVDAVVSSGGGIYSSTHIREHLAAGKPAQAAVLLGRPFEIAGPVVKGDQRGRELGFPTANLKLGSYLQPAFGGYVVRAGLEADGGTRWLDGVANIGNRPTLDGTRLLLETHIFDFDEDIYGQYLRIALIEFLRPEQKFDGIEALKERIEIDSGIARRTVKIRSAGAP
mgnify:FL=1